MRIFSLLIMLLSMLLTNAQEFRNFEEALASTLLLEEKTKKGFEPVGTAFLLTTSKGSPFFFLVTCKHLLEGKEIYATIVADSIAIMPKGKLGHVIVENTIWEYDDMKLRTRILIENNPDILVHDTLDIAAIPIQVETSRLPSNLKITTAKGFSKFALRSQIQQGNNVFFLGFPFKLGTYKNWSQDPDLTARNINLLPINIPILRRGSVAWISRASDEFLVDGFSYEGNSGSPLFLAAEDGDVYLIGMIIGHLGLKIERSSGEAELKGNAGLSRALWIDDIVRFINGHSKL